MRSVLSCLVAVAASMAVMVPAHAGVPIGTPGPLVGAGIPALLGLAYVYRRIRKSRGE